MVPVLPVLPRMSLHAEEPTAGSGFRKFSQKQHVALGSLFSLGGYCRGVISQGELFIWH